ncbi:hypothetical protein IEQ34_000251 [Dendrobium chrysotoxum]|uniref:Uncharacterized protein n=1 Tax=Dendrobium chrysotoxum TaxID=161865 RepID=A0AAV7HSD4_DENCH|nr:hypothetical protein IEQ34_000251 [Dendrobium chrysotoxum]
MSGCRRIRKRRGARPAFSSLIYPKKVLLRIKLVPDRDFGEMTSNRVDALEGKLEQFKSHVKEKVSTMERRLSSIENQLGGMEEMMRKLLKMQSKTSPMVPMTNSNQDLTWILLVKSKGKEIGREEFNEESFFHQGPPPGAPIRGKSRFQDEGTTMREFFSGGLVEKYENLIGRRTYYTSRIPEVSSERMLPNKGNNYG